MLDIIHKSISMYPEAKSVHSYTFAYLPVAENLKYFALKELDYHDSYEWWQDWQTPMSTGSPDCATTS